MSPPRFAGFYYYEKILNDPAVWQSLQTTAIIVALTVAAQMVVGFALALLFEKKFPGRRILLMLVLTPMMLSFVAVGAFFRYYYEPTFGLVSQAAAFITDGLSDIYVLIISDQPTAPSAQARSRRSATLAGKSASRPP